MRTVNSWSRRAAWMLAALVNLAPAAQAATGRTPGTFVVAPSGAATYSIPIWAPPGPGGVQPKISLSYNSQAGIGSLGIGWSLNGLSSIYRCNSTIAQDGAAAPVTLTYSDRFCLDGKRLRLTSSGYPGTYGQDATTYQTEVADFSNVTAHGVQGNGPAYFTVQGRDGRTYQYGSGGNSQVLATGTPTADTWLLNQVSDRAGNTMTVQYASPGSSLQGVTVPSTISWTPSSAGSTTYNYTMTFTYGTNVPQSSPSGYLAGTAVFNATLLSNIQVKSGSTTVKNYVLSYQVSPTTNRNELIKVQECADAGATNCLLPTTMTYQAGQTGLQARSNITYSGLFYTLYDLNGDGYSDLIYAGTTVQVAFGGPTGFGSWVNTGVTDAGLYGDLLGQGQDGILTRVSGYWWYYTWNGSSFTGVNTGRPTSGLPFALVDVNGDGLPDLVQYDNLVYTGLKLYTVLNTSANGVISFSSTSTLAYTAPAGGIGSTYQLQTNDKSIRSLDFNGDGRQDVVVSYETGVPNTWYTYSLVSNGSTFTPTLIATTPVGVGPAGPYFNFNSDACTDYAAAQTVYISACNGAQATSFSSGANSGSFVAALDWDGDGRTDLLLSGGGVPQVFLSTGTGLAPSFDSGLSDIPTQYYNGLFTIRSGDGLDGVFFHSSGSGPYPYNITKYALHNGAGTPADLLTNVTDGFGNSASPTYVSIAQSNYTKPTDAVYPYQNYVGPLYVVNQVTSSDPSSPTGGTYQQTFSYAGAWKSLQGRGLTSFASVQQQDLRNSVWNTRNYERVFPYTGMLTRQIDSQNAGNTLPIRNVSNTLANVVLDSTAGNQRTFSYTSNSTTQSYEVGGSADGQLITTAASAYTFDNYGNTQTVITTTTDNDLGSPYYNSSWTTTTTNTPSVDTAHWCLTLMTQSVVAYTASDASPSVTRTRQFTPDTTNCRYSQIVTEPSSASYKVTEAFGFDVFGNVNSDTLTGINMTARHTSSTWGTTGQYPMTLTDGAGAQLQLNYDFNYGVLSSVTDANNLTTSWQYADGFSRRTREDRPDGTYTTWAYNDCGSLGGCLIGAHSLEVAQTKFNSDGSVQTDSSTYFDPLGRFLIDSKRMLSAGSYDRNEVRYDNLGRVAKRAAPCTWSGISTACSFWTVNSYDAINRVTQVQRPISATNTTLQTTTYQYVGRTSKVTDPQSNPRTQVTDVNGWLRKTQDAYGYTVTLGYDAAGSKISTTDSSGRIASSATFKYGLAPFKVTTSDGDIGAWSYGYDALGDLTSWTDAKGKQFSETYDALSRPLTRKEPDLFTQWTWGSSATAHNISRLEKVCTGTGTNPTTCTGTPGYGETEIYDNLGRLSQRAITIPSSGTYTYTWAYGATTGMLDTMTYPLSPVSPALQLKYGYQNGLLQSVTDVSDAPNVTVWQANATNPANQVTQETLGNGIVTNRTYDAVTHWVQLLQSGAGGGAGVKNLAVLYDLMGNVTQRQDNNLALTENIYYDNDYRLTSSTLNGTQNLSVTYDATGNITSRSDVASGATWTYNTTHKHAVSKAGSTAFQYSYDANGNMTARQGSTITWASYNYPISASAGTGSTAETVALSYGPDRQRWKQQYTGNSTTETTYYVGNSLEIVISGSVTDYRHYIYAGSRPIAVLSRKSTGAKAFSYLLADHENSISGITNSTGSTTVNESFTAFGSRRNPTTWSGAAVNADLTAAAAVTRQGYTFQTQLGLWMGLNHMKGRVEDSITGRFLSPDPRIPDPSSPQDYNRYSYVTNNPLSYVDPSGFDECVVMHDAMDNTAFCLDIPTPSPVLPTPPPAPPTPPEPPARPRRPHPPTQTPPTLPPTPTQIPESQPHDGGQAPGSDTQAGSDNTGPDAQDSCGGADCSDETGSGPKGDRSVQAELARQVAEQKAAADRANGDENGAREADKLAQRAIEAWNRAMGYSSIPVGGVAPGAGDGVGGIDPKPGEGANINGGINPGPNEGSNVNHGTGIGSSPND